MKSHPVTRVVSSSPHALFARRCNRWILVGAIAPVGMALSPDVLAADKPVPPSFTLNSDAGAPVFTEGLEEGFVSGAANITDANPKNSSPELTLRMGQSTATGADAWADNRTWVYTGQVFTGPNGQISIAANNDDFDWFKINGVIVIDNNAWDQANAGVASGLTPNSWVDFEYRVGNGGGGAGPSGQNNNGALNWNNTTGVVFSYEDELLSLDASQYNLGRPTEAPGGGATLFRYQAGLGFTDDLRVTGNGTVTIDGNTGNIFEQSLKFESAATLTVNDGTGVHKRLNFADGTTLATNAGPLIVNGTSDVRLGKVSDGGLTGVRLVAGGAGQLIIDNVDVLNPNDLDGTTLEAGAGGHLTIRGSNNINPVATITTPLTISGAGGVINIGSAATGQVYNKAITANESGVLEHTTNTADTIGSTTQPINVAAGKTLTVRNTANTLTIASNLLGATVANDSTSIVKYTGNVNLTSFTNVAGRAQLRGNNTQLTNINVSGGRLELLGNYSFTNSPNITGSGTLALKNAGNAGTIPATITVPTGNLEFVPGAIGTSALTLNGGQITLAPDITGLNGNYYAVAPNNTANQNADFFTRESYVSLFSTLTATTPNVLTSVGETEVLSFNPDGSNAAMYSRYGFTAADNIISRMDGKIYIPVSGNYTFSTRSDDGSVMFLDGVKVVDNNFFQGMTTRAGSTFLSAGLHDIDIGFYEGGGGNGLEVFWSGPGISNQLLSNAVLFPDATPTTFTNPVNVTENSTINSTSASSVVQNVTVTPGKTLTTSGTNIFATNLNLSAGTTTINTQTGNTFTANDIVSGGAAVNIVKTGGGVFAIDDVNTAVPQLPTGSTITVNQGALGVLLGGATNPLGAATITYNGGGVVLSSKSGNQTFAIPTFTGNGSIEARKIASGVAGTTATPIAITLTGNLNVPTGQTMTLGTADNYVLNLGGTATGSGTVIVNGGKVVDTSGTGLQNLNLAINALGGTANVEIKSNTPSLASLASDAISNANVTLGTGSGPVTLTITGAGSGRFAGNLTAGASPLTIVKNGAGSQSVILPLGSTAVPNIAAVTVNAGTMELSPGAIGAAPINLAGGTLQMITPGLTLRSWEADPNATGAYGNTLDTFGGVLSHYKALGNPVFVTNTSNNNNQFISYNPGGGDTPPPFEIHGYADADTIEATFSGKIFITAAGDYKFSPRSDDGSTVYVDGQAVSLNNFAQGVNEQTQAPRDGTITLTPGYHDILITFNEGGGGQGVFVDITGPNGTRRTLSNSELFTTDLTANNVVNLTASSGVDARGGRTELGTLNWTAGTTLTSVSGTGAFGTTNLPGAGTYTVSGAGNVEPGKIAVTGNAAVTLTNSGTGALILNNTTTAQLTNAASAINVNGGGKVVVVSDSTAGSTNPLGSATVNLGGAGGSGELVLSNKVAENFTSSPTLAITGNAAITADNLGGGAVSGTAQVPIVATLSTPLPYGGNTLSLRSGSNYELALGGAVTGTGALNVTGGVVTANAAVTSGALNVSGGRFTTGNLTAASATVSNNATLRLNGPTNIAGGTTVNTGGTLQINGVAYTGGNISLNRGTLQAAGGVTNLSSVVVDGSAPTATANALEGRLFPNLGAPTSGFGSELSVVNTLTERPAFIQNLANKDFNFGPRYNADGPIASFFGTTAADTNIFTMAFTGKFTAAETGLHSFKKAINDDGAAFWVDLNQNGMFETNGSAGNERVAFQAGCCGNSDNPLDSDGGSVTLTAGQSYKVAIVLLDTGGGSSLAARFSTPSIAETFVNPGSAAQAGFWSVDTGGGNLRIDDTAELTLGVANNINDVVFNGAVGTLRFNNAAARTTNVGTIRSSSLFGTNTIDLGTNDTLNVNTLAVNETITVRKTGAGTMVATNQIIADGATLEVAGGRVVLNGTGVGAGTLLANGTGTALVNGSIGGLAAADTGGTIGGSGRVASLEIRSGGAVSPGGATPGTLTIGTAAAPGTLTLNGGGQVKLDIVSATSFDSLAVNGTVLATGNIPLQLTLGYNPTDFVDRFTILLNDGDASDPITGGGALSYNGVPIGQNGVFTVDAGGFTQMFQVNYAGGDGNDVVLSAVPEPGTVVTLLGGLGALVGLQRFRRRKH